MEKALAAPVPWQPSGDTFHLAWWFPALHLQSRGVTWDSALQPALWHGWCTYRRLDPTPELITCLRRGTCTLQQQETLNGSLCWAGSCPQLPLLTEPLVWAQGWWRGDRAKLDLLANIPSVPQPGLPTPHSELVWGKGGIEDITIIKMSRNNWFGGNLNSETYRGK